MSKIDYQALRKAKVSTKEFVEEHLHYDGKDFFWKKREPSSFSDSRTCKVWNTRIAGKRAGGISAQGYVEIQIKGSRYKAHRLAWCLVHGDIPTDMQVDLNRPGFPGECFICELRLPDHRFRWKHNKLFLLLPEEYGPAFPAIVDCYTSPPT